MILIMFMERAARAPVYKEITKKNNIRECVYVKFPGANLPEGMGKHGGMYVFWEPENLGGNKSESHGGRQKTTKRNE